MDLSASASPGAVARTAQTTRSQRRGGGAGEARAGTRRTTTRRRATTNEGGGALEPRTLVGDDERAREIAAVHARVEFAEVRLELREGGGHGRASERAGECAKRRRPTCVQRGVCYFCLAGSRTEMLARAIRSVPVRAHPCASAAAPVRGVGPWRALAAPAARERPREPRSAAEQTVEARARVSFVAPPVPSRGSGRARGGVPPRGFTLRVSSRCVGARLRSRAPSRRWASAPPTPRCVVAWFGCASSRAHQRRTPRRSAGGGRGPRSPLHCVCASGLTRVGVASSPHVLAFARSPRAWWSA